MDTVLADALLSQCRDADALLRAVGGEDGALSAERAESLRLLLQRAAAARGGWRGEAAQKRVAREAALGRCLRTLLGGGGDAAGESPQEWRRVVRAVCGALHCCAALCGSPLAEQLAREALHACEGTGWRHVEAAVEILAAVAPWLQEPALLKRSAGLALGLLWGEEEENGEKALLVAGRLLPALGRNGAALGHVWEGVMLPPEAAPQRASRALLVLSALSDAVFPAGAQQRTGAGSAGEAAQVLDARLCSSFWTVVQKGLTENDALCRKRARYLLKRAVDLSEKLRGECRCSQDPGNEPCLFWWCAEQNEQLTRFWENYILIMETLEGNQIHVIKPVLPKLNSLYEYAVSKQKGCWLLHPSWHLCIYQRMFDSENKTLTKAGIIHFLEIWQTKDLPTSPEFSEFIIGPLMDALSESSLYSRASGQIIGTFPPLGMKLQKFLATFFTNLPDKEKSDFLLKFIQKMSNRHWCAVPILFLSMALAHIPAYRALDGEGLLALREVLQCTMITHQILLRGAAQCYLLEAAIHLTDTEKVSLSDISNFIICLRPDESLGRGTVLWTMLCDWLHINDRHFQRPLNCDAPQDKSVLSVYVQFLVKDYLKIPVANSAEDCLMPDGFEAKLVAVMILLAADVEEMRHEYNGNGCTERIELKRLLNPLLDILLKLGTNPYISSLKADKSLHLLLKLLQLCSVRCSRPQVDGVIMFLQNSFLPATESILDFLLRKLTTNELDTIVDLQRCDLYLEVLSEFMNFCSTNVQKSGPSNRSFISSLINASLCNLQRMGSEEEVKVGDQIQKVVSMASLCAVCEIIDEKPELQLESLPAVDTLKTAFSCAKLNHVLKKPCSMETNSSLEEQASHQGWGKIVARYIHDQWVCLHFTLNNYQNFFKGKSLEQFFSIQKCTSTLQSALEAIMILPSDHVLPVFRCMQILISKLLESAESLCIETFDLAWKIIFSLSNTQLIFWPNLKAFVQFVFDPEVLAAAAKSKNQAYTKIKEIIFQMIEMSSTRTGVFNVLLSYCCQSWIHPTSDDSSEVEKAFSNASNYSELLIEGCLFGTVFRRDQRLIQEVCAFVQNLGDECAANVVTESTNRDDHYVRVCAIKFLCLLDELNTLHKKFIEDFVMKLLDKAEFMSKTKNRYYVNSLQHRIKNRLWQTLLVMFPKLHEDILTRTIDRILQAAHSNNQASVKYLIEWNIILILHKFPQFFPKFWDCFDYGEDHLKTSICTFLAVLSHFDIILQDTCEKTPALKKALVVVLKWCFHHNFSVRLYALMALKKIWGMCKASCMNDFETLAPVIESSLNQAESMHGTGNAKKNWQRIQKHFFFENFHPLNDYCLETIFYALPRLSEIAEEEWIPLSKFIAFTDIPCSSTFPRYYSQTTLLDLKPSDWSQQDMGLNSAEPGNQRQWTDVQKKIIPWKDSALDLDLELEFQDRTKLGKSSSKLIVVASLIDKPTNLGGLCRTCEIFGVSALIVGNLHCINDKQFQYLSVSAEQWLSLVEVKPFQLIDYLEQKKIEGYTIIGVEQTAKSCDLTEYQFPEKSLLLLGNEHEGIPANLIQQLDTCVEIPQQGVIRSLNVHVSGALLIWEYTRQQIIKENKER